MCSELTPRARILDTRIPQLIQPCSILTLFPPKGAFYFFVKNRCFIHFAAVIKIELFQSLHSWNNKTYCYVFIVGAFRENMFIFVIASDISVVKLFLKTLHWNSFLKYWWNFLNDSSGAFDLKENIFKRLKLSSVSSKPMQMMEDCFGRIKGLKVVQL